MERRQRDTFNRVASSPLSNKLFAGDRIVGGHLSSERKASKISFILFPTLQQNKIFSRSTGNKKELPCFINTIALMVYVK